MGKRNNRSRNRRPGKRDANQNDNNNSAAAGGGNGRGNSGRGAAAGKRKSIPFDPEKHFLPAPVPERDYDSCPISGEQIDDIFTAIADPQTGKPSRFDSVLERLSRSETLQEDERIAYIGRGTFGVIAMEKGDNNRPHLVVRKRIEYESSNNGQTWRKELSPGISRDYLPHPEPLAELYSQDELREFPRFDSPGGGSLARNNQN